MNKPIAIATAIFALTAARSTCAPADDPITVRARKPNGEIILLHLPGGGTYSLKNARTGIYSRRADYYPLPAFPPSAELTQSLASFRDTLAEPIHLSFDPNKYWPSRNPK